MPDNNDVIAEAIFDLSKSIRLLGNGNVDRGDNSLGAIEGLAIAIKESSKNIASALNDISQGIAISNEQIAKALNNVADVIHEK